MTDDPETAFERVRVRLEQRQIEILRDLQQLSLEALSPNAQIQASLTASDLEEGWRRFDAIASVIRNIDAIAALEIIASLELIAVGMFTSGPLLTRDEVVSGRFRSNAPEIARAAKAHKQGSNRQIEVDIIEEELKATGLREGGLSSTKIAGSILVAVNDRLRARDLKPLSVTTIWRRMRDFNL